MVTRIELSIIELVNYVNDVMVVKSSKWWYSYNIVVQSLKEI